MEPCACASMDGGERIGKATPAKNICHVSSVSLETAIMVCVPYPKVARHLKNRTIHKNSYQKYGAQGYIDVLPNQPPPSAISTSHNKSIFPLTLGVTKPS